MKYYIKVPYEVVVFKERDAFWESQKKDLIIPLFHFSLESFEEIAPTLDIFTVNKISYKIRERQFVYNKNYKGSEDHAYVLCCEEVREEPTNPEKFWKELKKKTGGELYARNPR
jgi:hypothetical protein